ncbi:sialic acid-binding Ig-like lectin 12 [Sarcophilus harrisii]|uniref:sialic acid-binding Ig-like lectin 12 n=1 Tax=Sarcophilus harrisii TaxID=9305 RepID=UPI001301EA7A|nr:sialic acid-binding Ig-like lectin 12 [Sarcophilus harrisii]
MLLLLFLPSIEALTSEENFSCSCFIYCCLNLSLPTGLQKSPPDYYVQMPAAVTVQEGLCITILCTFHHPPTSSSAAHGYWFKERSNTNVSQPVATNDPTRKVQEAFRGRFHLVGDPQYPHTAHHRRLKEDNLTEKPVIYSPEPLEEGQLATLVCLAPWICPEGTPPTFFWTGAAVPSLQPSSPLPAYLGRSSRTMAATSPVG